MWENSFPIYAHLHTSGSVSCLPHVEYILSALTNTFMCVDSLYRYNWMCGRGLQLQICWGLYGRACKRGNFVLFTGLKARLAILNLGAHNLKFSFVIANLQNEGFPCLSVTHEIIQYAWLSREKVRFVCFMGGTQSYCPKTKCIDNNPSFGYMLFKR